MASVEASTESGRDLPRVRDHLDHARDLLERLIERIEAGAEISPSSIEVAASYLAAAERSLHVLHILVPTIGVAAFALVVPITIAMLVVLAFLILSYRETIKEYPTAGGAYMVTRDNFGLMPAQVAGAALLTDYVLTVSVSVAAGTAALASAVDGFAPYTLWISIAFVVIIAYGNLRGVKESGR